MAACLHRERTSDPTTGFKGEGQHVSTSLLEASLYSLSYVTSSYLNGGVDYKRMGNEHPMIAPYTVYKTYDDEYIVIGVATDRQFKIFSEILDLKDPDSRFVTNEKRVENSKLLHDTIHQAFTDSAWTLSKLMEAFTQKGIPFSEINSIKTLFNKAEIKKLN